MTLALLPLPVSCTHHTAPGCHISADTLIIADAGTRPEAELLSLMLAQVFGRPLHVCDEPCDELTATTLQTIRFVRSTSAGTHEESYRLDSTNTGILLQAANPIGLGWAVQALVQLVPPHAPAGAEIPSLTIIDQPRFGWRGVMLDPARHFLPVEEVLRYIDLIARHRFNRLHLHLTDDQGWRMEIRRYPRLTSVGAWRSETLVGHLGKPPHAHDGTPHGGYYSQDDCRRIVAYAAARHVTVVPEIDLPGHMQAAIAAYPWLGNDGKECGVFTKWGINPHILNAEERTLGFLEDVLSEVMEVFPSPWIHVGGDEAIKDEWTASARIQERIRELGCADEHGLQSHIIKRMDRFLTARGRRLLGWEEIAEGGLSPNATVMSWRGITAGIEAAKLGHDVIMAPVSHTYFDYYQHPDFSTQPLSIAGTLTLEKTYSYDPIPPELNANQAQHILGGQGQLWGEYIVNREQLDILAFPRLCALAEVLWTAQSQRDWKDFQERLAVHCTRLEALGVGYFRVKTSGSDAYAQTAKHHA